MNDYSIRVFCYYSESITFSTDCSYDTYLLNTYIITNHTILASLISLCQWASVYVLLWLPLKIWLIVDILITYVMFHKNHYPFTYYSSAQCKTITPLCHTSVACNLNGQNYTIGMHDMNLEFVAELIRVVRFSADK